VLTTVWRHSEANDVILHKIAQNTKLNDVTQESSDVIQNPIFDKHNLPISNGVTQESYDVIQNPTSNNIISQCRLTSHKVIWCHLDVNLIAQNIEPNDVTQESYDVIQNHKTLSSYPNNHMTSLHAEWRYT